MEKKNYRLKVRCANCGHRQVVVIPVKVQWQNYSFILKYDSGYCDDEVVIIKCKNCDCATLVREIK